MELTQQSLSLLSQQCCGDEGGGGEAANRVNSAELQLFRLFSCDDAAGRFGDDRSAGGGDREIAVRRRPFPIELIVRVQKHVEGEAMINAGQAAADPKSLPLPPSNSATWQGFLGFHDLKWTLFRRVILPLIASSLPPTASSEATATACALAASSRAQCFSSFDDAPPLLPALLQTMRSLRAAGHKPPSGVLLYGPPGCGKTCLARAIASSAGCSFLHVSCPKLLSPYLGDSEAAIRRVFACARASAPCVLLLDDIDAIAGARGSGLGGGGGAGVLDRQIRRAHV